MAITAQYTSQVVFMHTPEFRARIDKLAEERGVSLAEIMRQISDAGIDTVEGQA